MGQYHNPDAPFAGKRITLSRLKEQFYALNMQMLLAIESHDAKTQNEIKEKMDELQVQMDDLSLGGKPIKNKQGGSQ